MNYTPLHFPQIYLPRLILSTSLNMKSCIRNKMKISLCNTIKFISISIRMNEKIHVYIYS